jgi:hypothetical protein
MAIDVAGMLKNMQHTGFTVTSSLSELMDNAWSAGSDHIRIMLEDNYITISDNGCGMTKEELLDCNIFHRRKESTSFKHGRFGIGSKHAGIHLSNQQKMTMYSFKDGLIHMIELDYQAFIREKEMHLHVSEIGISSLPIWQTYSFQKGTVIRIETTPTIVSQIKGLMESKDETNLIYHFGLMYCTWLKECTLEINGHRVKPIDLLQWDSAEDKYSNELNIYYKDTFQIQYLGDDNGTLKPMYRDFTSSKKGRQLPFVQEGEKVATVRLKCTYRKDWKEVLNPILPFECTCQEDLDSFHGKFILRNQKVITRFQVKSKQSGDFHLRSVVPNTHVFMEFEANEITDRFFGVQVNKSALLEENMDEHLKSTIDQLLKDYYDFIIKKIKANEKSVPNPPATKIPTPSASKKPTPSEPKPKSSTVSLKPTTPIQPLQAPPIETYIEFSKTEQQIVIQNKKINRTYRLSYKGQYCKHLDSLKETHKEIGDERFVEYIQELENLNRFIS